MPRFFASLDRDLRFIFLSYFLWGAGLFLYINLQPLYVTQLGASPTQVGLTLGLGSLFVALLYAPVGLWADRRGRKGVIMTGWWMGALAGFAMAFAPNWRWFIPAIALYTLSNFAGSVVNGYIASKVSAAQRGQVYALLSSGPAISSILAPALGGWLAENFGLRVVYVCAALFYCLSALAISMIRPQPVEPKATSENAVRLLRSGVFMWHIVLLFLIFFAIDVGQILAPKYLQEVRGLSFDQIGLLGTASAAGVFVLMLLIGKLSAKTSWPLLIPQFLVLIAVALLIVAPSFPILLLAFLISGSNRLIRPPTLARMSHLLPPATMSFGLGVYQTAMQIGYSVSPYVAGVLYTYDPRWPLYCGVIGLLITLGLTLTLPRAPVEEIG